MDTVSYYLGLYPGDPLDRETSSPRASGRLVGLGVSSRIGATRERRAVGGRRWSPSTSSSWSVRSSTRLTFEGNKKHLEGRSEIKDKLDERGVDDSAQRAPARWRSSSKIQAADSRRSTTSEGLPLGEHRRLPDRQTSRRATEEASSTTIDEGGKVKIDDDRLRRQRRLLRQQAARRAEEDQDPIKWPLPKSSARRTIYTKEENWDEDRDNLREPSTSTAATSTSRSASPDDRAAWPRKPDADRP